VEQHFELVRIHDSTYTAAVNTEQILNYAIDQADILSCTGQSRG